MDVPTRNQLILDHQHVIDTALGSLGCEKDEDARQEAQLALVEFANSWDGQQGSFPDLAGRYVFRRVKRWLCGNESGGELQTPDDFCLENFCLKTTMGWLSWLFFRSREQSGAVGNDESNNPRLFILHDMFSSDGDQGQSYAEAVARKAGVVIDADRVVDQRFMKVVANWHGTTRKSFENLVAPYVRQEVLQEKKKKVQIKSHTDLGRDQADNTPDKSDSQTEILEEAIAQLPDQQRAIMEFELECLRSAAKRAKQNRTKCRDGDGYTLAELADHLGLDGTTKGRAREAERLRDEARTAVRELLER